MLLSSLPVQSNLFLEIETYGPLCTWRSITRQYWQIKNFLLVSFENIFVVGLELCS